MEELIQQIQRETDSHKGENGRIGIIAGSKDFTGAPALCAKAALRTGADLTKILTSESVSNVVAGYSENFIVDSYPSDYFDQNALDKARELEEWSDVLVIGPGLGDVDVEAVRDFVSSTSKPIVVDADAIKPALEADISNAVFTPHSGEAEVIKQKFGSIENFVEEKEAIVVVKGSTDRVYTPGKILENDTGDPTMTVGGTGDVLTGTIASLLSKGLDEEEAAHLGLWLNGKAGEKAAEKYGDGALASDIIEMIPEVLN